MVQKYFNFNNEADLTPVDVDELSGEVTFAYEGREATFDSLQEFAEFYATARNVLAENLKNWELTEDGESFAFVLKAGTAGITADEIQALVSALNNAGLTPAQIGEAVAAATTNTSHGTTTSKVVTVETEVERHVYEMSKTDELTLCVYFNSDKDDLTAKVIQEVTSEYYIADIEDDVEDAVYDILADARSYVEQEYPDIPLYVAVRLVTGSITPEDDEAAYEKLYKASMAASAASRFLPVTLITEGNHSVPAFLSNDNIETLDCHIIEYNGKFVLA